MPPRLLDRCRPDSINGYRRAVVERRSDVHALISQQRRTAAIYLCGYIAEMILKAAYFNVIGLAGDDEITTGRFREAQETSDSLGLTWDGNYHNLLAWAELIVQLRQVTPNQEYPDPDFGTMLLNECATIQSLWNVFLRYRPNQATEGELQQVFQAMEWLFDNRNRI
jgi:hypothetical protein